MKPYALGTFAVNFFFIFFSFNSFAQSEKLSGVVTEVAETLAANELDQEAASTFTDRLHELFEDPVRINSADPGEISRLFFLSDFQVKALTEYITSSGKIVSVYELANIPGFDRVTAEMIIPFITLEFRLANNPDSARWRNTLLTNFTLKSSPDGQPSLGSDWKILTKYKFTSGVFSGGFTTEKDPGEKYLNGNPPLPDFLSAHLAYKGNGILKKIIIGDFSARFGQGSNINTGIQRGISLVSPGYMSSSDEVKPYTSTDENKFFRGIATSLVYKNIELSLFLSKNNSDATLSSPDSSGSYVETFSSSGVHNTSTLLKKKDSVSELVYGMILSYNLRNLKAGFIWSGNKFSIPVIPSINEPEKIFDFSGNRSDLYTMYYNLFVRKILLYGEFTVNDDRKYAIIQGLSFRPADRLTINFLFRDYAPGFPSFYGQGPGSSSKTSNEMGILGNFTFEAARHLFLSGGADIEHSPWLKYRCSAPTRGMRKALKISWLPSERLTFETSYNYSESMYDDNTGNRIPDQAETITRTIKASFRYSVNANLSIGGRGDYKIADPSRSRGFNLCQDINYIFRKIPVTVWFRFCLFSTDDWASRIYTYENDLLYSFSVPALAGSGSRSYLMVKWKVNEIAELRIKYGMTSVVTNGNMMKNTDEIKMQFRLWF
jgi:hypothetical protein